MQVGIARHIKNGFLPRRRPRLSTIQTFYLLTRRNPKHILCDKRCIVGRQMPSVTRLGIFLHFWQLFKALATINLPKSPTFLGNFCKGVKIFHFSSEINFGQLLQTFGDFSLVTLVDAVFAVVIFSTKASKQVFASDGWRSHEMVITAFHVLGRCLI